tara:strand:- start:3271 stop:3939 length:669 start_codon:yes stop_codon:yes gene_type:complete
MAQIGTMTGTAGAVTSLNLPYCPEYLIVGDTYSGTFELSNFSVSINGQSTIELIGADDIDAVAEIKSHSEQSAATSSGLMMAIQLSDGQINAPTLIKLTNEGTNADNIFGVSTSVGTAPYRYSQFTVNATSNQQFSEFDSVLINSSPTNIDSIEIQWVDGFKDRFSPLELPVLFRSEYAALGNSQYSASSDIAWINNEDGNIANCTIYTNSSGSATCTVGRI